MRRKAIIIGAGPAGLTAAYELLKRTDIKPIILEKSGDIGGISKTINYKGNRMDIGGHRFFSKSDRVMNWWLNIMPIEKTEEETITINYQNKTQSIHTAPNKGSGEPVNPGLVMLVRKRLSRIYFLRTFFTYPIQLSIDTLRKLGFIRTIRILFSYLVAQLIPRKPEKSLEDFFINRFGRQLYLLFFKDYTEKVWGIACNEISAEWGAQRIKGVSISKAIQHAAQTMFKRKGNAANDISQKDTETSLIEQFFYPALGPGQLWEEVARKIEILGGTILMHQNVTEINSKDGKLTGVVVTDSKTGETTEYHGDYFFSTMPVQELIGGMNGKVPGDVKKVAAGLQYRDFITVGVLLERLSTTDINTGENKTLELKDTWIYIQEKDVKVGRLQLFNNWSPFMVNKPGTIWIGMEYFCNEGDAFWQLSDEEIKRTAVSELEKMRLVQIDDVLDSTVHRIEKTYPAYFGTYNQFDKIRSFVDQYENLFLVGRNGMHKYNNADHSMLTAMTAVDNICEGVKSKENIWAINTEQEYHEVKNKETKTTKEMRPQKQELPDLKTSFSGFVFRQQSKFLWIAIGLSLVQFVVFKILYPYANVMDDSLFYIDAAARNLDINYWPIGYSKFLRLLNIFSGSDLALVIFQYCLLQGALLYFLFSVLYFLKPGNFVKWGLMIFFCINPALLSISNYVLSDGIFTGLSLIWVTQLLWILFRPNKQIILTHSFLLFLLFSIRYNAIYYPLISAFVVLTSTISWRIKILSQGIAILLIGLFVWQTSSHYKSLTGKRQFSPFSGWMLANNALIMYRNLPIDNQSDLPKHLEHLNEITAHHLDSIRYLSVRPDTSIQVYYMWYSTSPLNKFLAEKYKGDNTTPYFNRWVSVGDMYGQYGKFLIKKHPTDFVRYFIWQNALWYFAPLPECLPVFNRNYDTVPQVVASWFNYKSTKVRCADKEIKLVKYYTMLLSGANIIFLMLIIWTLFSRNQFFLNSRYSKALRLAVTIWLFNIGFSVMAAPVVLRYQLFTMVLLVSLGAVVMEILLKSDNALQNKESITNDEKLTELAFTK
jgi:protoporphyrinogen oxidase